MSFFLCFNTQHTQLPNGMPLPLMMGGQEKQDNEKNALFQSVEQKAGGLEAASAAAAAALRSKGRNGIN